MRKVCFGMTGADIVRVENVKVKSNQKVLKTFIAGVI